MDAQVETWLRLSLNCADEMECKQK